VTPAAVAILVGRLGRGRDPHREPARGGRDAESWRES